MQAPKSVNSARRRRDFGKIRHANSRWTRTAASKKMNPTTARPPDELGHPVQNRPTLATQLEVAREITQNNAAMAAITAVAKSKMTSLICIAVAWSRALVKSDKLLIAVDSPSFKYKKKEKINGFKQYATRKEFRCRMQLSILRVTRKRTRKWRCVEFFHRQI